ncbi:MAG: DUF3352 domain-containing protein [Candidatus Poribacteria bacterium]|nr:DUF3352 domain-containing protein [Candidatus Poribacteria bacterium]
MNKRFTLPLFVAAFLTTILFGTYFITQPINVALADGHEVGTTSQSEAVPLEIPKDSVLHLIPETTLGVIYCPSLLDLDDRINAVASELVPQAGESPELLSQILAEAFGAGFESLAELEEIGLDLNQDFAIFLTSLDPPSLSATVHLTDPDAMMQVIETEAEGSEPVQYNGETYWSTPEGSGSFAILENILVFSQQPEICQNVIDISKGTMKSIVANEGYASFLTNIMKGVDQLAAYFNLESIIAPFAEQLKEELQVTIDTIESDPSAMAAAPMVENMFNKVVEIVEELKSISATLQVEGTDVQLAPFLQFKTDGKIQEALKEMAPDELVLLNDLPNQGFINGAFQLNAKQFYEMNVSWLEYFLENDTELNEAFAELLEQMEEIYESMGDEWSFSVNFSDSFMPDYLVIGEMKDEQKLRTYMDEKFLELFQKSMQIMKDKLGDSPQMSMYDGAHVGNPVMHNGVEIKSFIFPNLGAVFTDVPDAANFMPQEMHWSYAFSEGLFYFAIGDTEQIKSALDSKAKVSESISENVSYQKLIQKLGIDNNMIFGISPIAMAKSAMNLAAKADPNAAAEINMFAPILMGLTESYSIGISGKVRDGGVGAKLLITLGDFKQIINTFMMMSGMGMM